MKKIFILQNIFLRHLRISDINHNYLSWFEDNSIKNIFDETFFNRDASIPKKIEDKIKAKVNINTIYKDGITNGFKLIKSDT